MYHSLHISSNVSSVILQSYFSEILKLPLVQKIIDLHISIHYNKIIMGRLSSLLRSLEKIWQIAAGATHSLFDDEFSSPVFDFIKVIKQTGHTIGDTQIMSVVISALFSALVGAVFHQCEKDKEKGSNIDFSLCISYLTGIMQFRSSNWFCLSVCLPCKKIDFRKALSLIIRMLEISYVQSHSEHVLILC